MWYYGVPIQDYEGDWQICTDCVRRTVIPETVGQYTGSTDKNSKKIFEGDIIENIVTSEKGVVQWFDEHSAFMIWSRAKNVIYFLYDNDFSYICVAGNIYDNPELIGEKTND